MKTSQILPRGIAAVTLLAMLTMANAQNTPTTSSNTTSAYPLPPSPPPPPPLAQPVMPAMRGTTAARGVPSTAAARSTITRGALPATTWTSEQAMNDAFINQFKNTGSFGGGRMPSPTMSVNPGMRLLLTDQVQVDGPAKTVSAAYRIYSLELIGIAMHKTPVAFVVVRHQDNPATLNTRVLTDFEEGALKDLQAGKQVVSQLVKTDRLVVGAVRAEQSCIPCHDGAKIGDLLGAFSYHLDLVAPPASSITSKTADGTSTPKTLTISSGPTSSAN